MNYKKMMSIGLSAALSLSLLEERIMDDIQRFAQ